MKVLKMTEQDYSKLNQETVSAYENVLKNPTSHNINEFFKLILKYPIPVGDQIEHMKQYWYGPDYHRVKLSLKDNIDELSKSNLVSVIAPRILLEHDKIKIDEHCKMVDKWTDACLAANVMED